MWPEILKIPGIGLSIQTYGTVIVLAFLVGAFWTRSRATATLGLDPERVFNVTFVLLFVGLIGARLVFAFSDYDHYAQRPLAFLKIWEGGLVGYGGLVACLLWLAWWLPRHPEMKGFAFLDLLARGGALALAIGWLAPLLAGDDYGKVTDAAWAIPAAWFQDGTGAATSVVRSDAAARLHPTQVYEVLWALGVFLALAVYAKRAPLSGRVAALFLLLHPIGHAVIELFRGDVKRGFVIDGVLSWSQFLAIPVFFAGVAIWLIRKPTGRPATPPAPAPRAP